MDKVLIVANTASMIKQFNMDNIQLLQACGYEVHVACNFQSGNTISDNEVKRFRQVLSGWRVLYFDVSLMRNPKAMKEHIKAYRRLKAIIAYFRRLLTRSSTRRSHYATESKSQL